MHLRGNSSFTQTEHRFSGVFVQFPHFSQPYYSCIGKELLLSKHLKQMHSKRKKRVKQHPVCQHQMKENVLLHAVLRS